MTDKGVQKIGEAIGLAAVMASACFLLTHNHPVAGAWCVSVGLIWAFCF